MKFFRKTMGLLVLGLLVVAVWFRRLPVAGGPEKEVAEPVACCPDRISGGFSSEVALWAGPVLSSAGAIGGIARFTANLACDLHAQG